MKMPSGQRLQVVRTYVFAAEQSRLVFADLYSGSSFAGAIFQELCVRLNLIMLYAYGAEALKKAADRHKRAWSGAVQKMFADALNEDNLEEMKSFGPGKFTALGYRCGPGSQATKTHPVGDEERDADREKSLAEVQRLLWLEIQTRPNVIFGDFATNLANEQGLAEDWARIQEMHMMYETDYEIFYQRVAARKLLHKPLERDRILFAMVRKRPFNT